MSAFTDQVKGRLKNSLGALTGNRALQRDGRRDERVGRTKQKSDHAIDAVRTKLDSVTPTHSSKDPKD